MIPLVAEVILPHFWVRPLVAEVILPHFWVTPFCVVTSAETVATVSRFEPGDDDHIASDLFNIHVVTEFSRDVRILTYNWCVLKLNR